MAYATLKFSLEEINAAGDVLICPDVPTDVYANALTIINNWRSAHNLPLLFFRLALTKRTRNVDSNCIVAQRIKRLQTIESKLKRLPRLKLAQLQDIGGCRAVLGSVAHIKKMVKLYEKSKAKHILDHKSDYIVSPKKDGYRGIHLIYRYNSEQYKSHNGLKIEIQLRSKLQHAWATAVETVSIFTGEALKFSQGSENWRRFFALMGTAIAMKERSPLVPGTPTNKEELVEEFKDYAERIDVLNKLAAYGSVIATPRRPDLQNVQYFLLELDSVEKKTRITGYVKGELEKASEEYLKIEQALANKEGAQAVLVSAGSLLSIKRAYPNYFLDLRAFSVAVSRILSSQWL